MINPGKALLTTAYLGPLQYFSKFLLHHEIEIEQWENYQKQSYRNRCNIFGANGMQCLVIPVCKGSVTKMPIRDITIDYSKSWQKVHWKSIESAYRLSPWFEFFEDKLIRFYDRNYQAKFLFDLNTELTEMLLSALNIPVTLKYTTFFENSVNVLADYRESIHPKRRMSKPDQHFINIAYPQVFESKHGFMPNLSIIDLLFNEGRHARDILMGMAKGNRSSVF